MPPSRRARRRRAVAVGSSASPWRLWCSPWWCSSSTCWPNTDWLGFGEVGLRVVLLAPDLVAARRRRGRRRHLLTPSSTPTSRSTRRLVAAHRAFEGIDVVEYVNERTVQGLRRGGLIGSVVLAIFVGAGTSAEWLMFQRALNGVPSARKTRSSITTSASTSSRCRPGRRSTVWSWARSSPAWSPPSSSTPPWRARAHPAAPGGAGRRAARAGGAWPLRAPRRPLRARARTGQRGASSSNRAASRSAHLSVAARPHLRAGRDGYIFQGLGTCCSPATVWLPGAGYTDVHAGLPGMRLMSGHRLALGALLIANCLLAAALALAAVRRGAPGWSP